MKSIAFPDSYVKIGGGGPEICLARAELAK